MMKDVRVSGWFSPTFVQIIRWYRCHNLPQTTWLHKSTNINANMWLRQKNRPFSTTDRFPSVTVRACKVTCDNFANAATSQRFLSMIKPRKQIFTTAACKKVNESSITIAASSVCKHEILTDRLNKIQLRTVWCSIFYFFSKQTMNALFHCTFAWICVDFSCKTAFISYHVTSAKTRVLKCCCLLFDWTEFWESSALLNRESWLAYDDFREKT